MSLVDRTNLVRWDTRNSGPKPAHQLKAHKHEINAVSFAPTSEWLLLTGSGDNASYSHPAGNYS
jgi:histone-binding protein RBBP4